MKTRPQGLDSKGLGVSERSVKEGKGNLHTVKLKNNQENVLEVSREEEKITQEEQESWTVGSA